MKTEYKIKLRYFEHIPEMEKNILIDFLNEMRVISNEKYLLPNGSAALIWFEIHLYEGSHFEKITYYSPKESSCSDIDIALPIGTVFKLAVDVLQSKYLFDASVSNLSHDIETFNAFLNNIVNNPKSLTIELCRKELQNTVFSGTQRINNSSPRWGVNLLQSEYIKGSPVIGATCCSLADILVITLVALAESGKSLKKCKLCGGYFVPNSYREKYCDNMNPTYPSKTCKQAYRLINLIEGQKNNDIKRLSKQIYDRLLLRSKKLNEYARAHEKYKKELAETESQFIAFRNELDEWKAMIKENKATNEEFYCWLIQQDNIGRKRKKQRGAV